MVVDVVTGRGAAGWRMRAHLGGDVALRVRLAQYRRDHPGVVIGDLGFGGTWQARLPLPAGEHVYTRYTLRELLDLLDGLESPPAGPSG